MNKRTAITIAIALIAVVYISPVCQGSVSTVTDAAATIMEPHYLAADELPLFAVWYILACIMFAIVVRIILGGR